MRVPRLRFTVRRMMVAMALAAIPLWLATTAVRVWQDPGSRSLYVYGQRRDDPESFTFYGMDAPFWPRYWRRLLHRPWPGTYVHAWPEEWAREYRVLGVKGGPIDLSDEGRVRGRISDEILHEFNDHPGGFASCPKCLSRARVRDRVRRTRPASGPPPPAA